MTFSGYDVTTFKVKCKPNERVNRPPYVDDKLLIYSQKKYVKKNVTDLRMNLYTYILFGTFILGFEVVMHG